jgi:hypothetical protein
MPHPELHLQLLHVPTCRPLLSPPLFPFLPGLARARHDYPEPPPAATSSSPWIAHRRSLNSQFLEYNSITLVSTSYSFNSRAKLRATNPHFVAVVSSCSGRARHACGQPTPEPLRPNPSSSKLPRALLVLAKPSELLNSGRNPVSDGAPPPPPRPHRGAPSSGLP